jgi:vacuolar protein sorting-associated protein 72
MASLLNTMEVDDFYKETYGGFDEEDNDNEFAYQSPVEDENDEVDSDFSIDENDEPKSDVEDDEEKAKRAAKRGLGVQTKAYKEPKRHKDGSKIRPPVKSEVKPKPRPQIKAVLMTEFGRKYTRASTVNKTAETAKRQKERMAKAKKLLKKKAKKGKKIERELTQEEKLEEAKDTEKLNLESLKKFEQMELENKRKAVRLSKRQVHGAYVRYRSIAMPLISSQNDTDRINVEEIVEDDEKPQALSNVANSSECHERTFLTFSDHDTYRQAFPN